MENRLEKGLEYWEDEYKKSKVASGCLLLLAPLLLSIGLGYYLGAGVAFLTLAATCLFLSYHMRTVALKEKEKIDQERTKENP